ncbi:MAG TPA: phage holin family protein [Gaiellaceae bacterium]|nr:phage holin family protein [Gaiellaceae bacterium]
MSAAYGEAPGWTPEKPRFRPWQLAVAWLLGAASLVVAAKLVPGASESTFRAALVVAALIAVLNAVLPPLIAALRIPFTALLGFFLVLFVDAGMLLLADGLSSGMSIDSFWSALLVALTAAAVGVVLSVLFGTNDDDIYSLRVVQRIARRSGERVVTDRPGIVFLEIDGLALPVLQRAMRDGHAPTLARWLEDGTHRLAEWEPDLSSQTGASQAGILLGSNDDIVAFRWVEKERQVLVACSSPEDCAELERRHSTGPGLLSDGGASRGNLFSGGADHLILTVSRMEAERSANPGYRAFLANGFNVARTFVLFGWEVILEWIAAAMQRRRDVRPRGHRGGVYPLLRATMCVIARDLIVYGVLTDMMQGRPAVYATFASYDEVAHHSGLERQDTLEALRKLDQQFGRIERARRYAARPYEIVVLSDHGQTQGATFRQRNGYGLDELVQRNLAHGGVSAVGGGDEQDAMVEHAAAEATGRRAKAPKNDVSGRDVVVLGSGNLGLVYLMEKGGRMTREELDVRHPQLLPALASHPHIGWVLVKSDEHGAVVLGDGGVRYLEEDRVEGVDPLAGFHATAPQHLLRTHRFEHAPDLLVGSFYDPALDEGCAFEELISFHGGLGGSQTQAFVLYPAVLPAPEQPIVGAETLHRVLVGWRRLLEGGPGSPTEPAPAPEPVTQR